MFYTVYDTKFSATYDGNPCYCCGATVVQSPRSNTILSTRKGIKFIGGIIGEDKVVHGKSMVNHVHTKNGSFTVITRGKK